MTIGDGRPAIPLGSRCETCGQPILTPVAWEWAVRSGGFTAYWRGSGALDGAYDAAERRIEDCPDERVAILLSASGGVSWGVADTRDTAADEWVVGRERWRRNEREAIRAGRAAEWPC